MPIKARKTFHIFQSMLDSNRFPTLKTILGNQTNMENLSKVNMKIISGQEVVYILADFIFRSLAFELPKVFIFSYEYRICVVLLQNLQ